MSEESPPNTDDAFRRTWADIFNLPVGVLFGVGDILPNSDSEYFFQVIRNAQYWTDFCFQWAVIGLAYMLDLKEMP